MAEPVVFSEGRLRTAGGQVIPASALGTGPGSAATLPAAGAGNAGELVFDPDLRSGTPFRSTGLSMVQFAASVQADLAFPGQYVRKAVTEAVSSANTGQALQNDDELFAAVEASSVYRFAGVLIVDGETATGRFKGAGTFPAGATVNVASWGLSTSASSTTASVKVDVSQGSSWSGAGSGVAGVGTPIPWRFEGNLVTGATAGTLQIQWAQLGAHATDTRVFAGSDLLVLKVG